MKLLKLIFKLRYKYRIAYLKYKGISIGKNTFISHKAYIDAHKGAKVKIGENCFITRNVIILNHSDIGLGGPKEEFQEFGGKRILGDVTIGDNVFIGVGSVIMPSVEIGNNSIVGALSVVSKSIPKNSVYAGIPAKYLGKTEEVLKKNFPEFRIEDWLLKYK